MNMKRLVPVLIIFALMLTASAAGATQTVYQSNKDMTLNADEVVVGTVKDTNSYTDSAKGGRVYTLTTVTVSEWVKGGDGKEIVVRQLGGQRESKISRVSGDAILKPGEEVVLFLKKGDGVRYLLSLSQSKFLVTQDQATGKKMVRQEMQDLTVWEKGKDGNYTPKALPPAQAPVLLNDFLTEIKGYIPAKK
jgi:hypothetical protein